MRTYLGYGPMSDTVQTHIFLFCIPTSPYDNSQTISNRRDTPQVCPLRINRRFPPEIFPFLFGLKCASAALDFRTYLGYVPTLDTVQTHIFRFCIPTSLHDNTQAIPKRRDTPQVCPPKSNRRFPPEIFPLPFGLKCALAALDFRTYLGYVPTTDTTL